MVEVIRKSNITAWNRLRLMGRKMEGLELKVGWFETAKYESGISVAHVATIQEFGYPKKNIPPRPFMRPTVAREENNWRKIIDQESKKIVAGTQTPAGMFQIIGLQASGQVAKSIVAVMAPPLKPATIAARKRRLAGGKTTKSLEKPLIDTGIMMETVTYTVEES